MLENQLLNKEKIDRQDAAFTAGDPELMRQAHETGQNHERQINRSLIQLAEWLSCPRVLLGMLRRPKTQRWTVLHDHARTLGINLLITDGIVSWILQRRVIVGLLRRPRSIRKALLAFELFQNELTYGLRSRISFYVNPRNFDPARENVLVAVHETSRTGAPILGWNIARKLSERYNIFIIRLNDGALTPEFEALSVETHGPFLGDRRNPTDIAIGLKPLFESRKFVYAIINSCESRSAIAECVRYQVPVLFLMHEFGTYVYPAAELKRAFDMSTEIVFPARMVASSSQKVHPPLANLNVRILPQGMSDVPSWNKSLNPDLVVKLQALSKMHEAGIFIVIGAGSVGFRKGVDLFLNAASTAQRNNTGRPIHFVWVGHGYAPETDMGYSIYLQEQTERAHLQNNVTFLGEVSDLEPIYALAHAFFLSSRLDPLPNVSIDAAYRGIPIICFEDASGTAEYALTKPATAMGVVPHLDADAAGRLICHLAADEEARMSIAEATRCLARETFNMDHYVAQLDALGRSHAHPKSSYSSLPAG